MKSAPNIPSTNNVNPVHIHAVCLFLFTRTSACTFVPVLDTSGFLSMSSKHSPNIPTKNNVNPAQIHVLCFGPYTPA